MPGRLPWIAYDTPFKRQQAPRSHIGGNHRNTHHLHKPSEQRILGNDGTRKTTRKVLQSGGRRPAIGRTEKGSSPKVYFSIRG